jgi:hypothetical protein
LVQPILDADHLGDLLWSGPKLEFFFFSIDVEMEYSSSNINVCSRGAEEWSPKDE